MSMILKKGDVSSHVYNLERVIDGLGFGGLAIDNTFDQKTENVIKYIQQAHNLTPDGIVGEKTFALLDRLYQADTPNFSSSAAPLTKTEQSRAVKDSSQFNTGKLAGVHPKMAEKAVSLIEHANADGQVIIITQGLRTFAQQDRLYAQGRTNRGRKVTNARGGRSYHNYGIAVDFAFSVGGKISWDEKLYRQIGKWSDAVGGLTWGGRWKFVDLPHVQLQGAPSTQAMLGEYRRLGGGQKAIEAIWRKYV